MSDAFLTLKDDGGVTKATFQLRDGRQRTFSKGKRTCVPRDLVTAFLKTGQIRFFGDRDDLRTYVYCRDVKGWVRLTEPTRTSCPECKSEIGYGSHVEADIPDEFIGGAR